MILDFDKLVEKYNIDFKGIIHIGAHQAEEMEVYKKYIHPDKTLWVEALPDKVDFCKKKYPDIKIVNAVVSDKEEEVYFNVANNGQSSSIFELGFIHKRHHPEVHYVSKFKTKTQLMSNIIKDYSSIPFNFINLDIQGAELPALKGFGDYLSNIDYIYTEINFDYIYEGISLGGEMDKYLSEFGFKRVETSDCSTSRWGDALYKRF